MKTLSSSDMMRALLENIFPKGIHLHGLGKNPEKYSKVPNKRTCMHTLIRVCMLIFFLVFKAFLKKKCWKFRAKVSSSIKVVLQFYSVLQALCPLSVGLIVSLVRLVRLVRPASLALLLEIQSTFKVSKK